MVFKLIFPFLYGSKHEPRKGLARQNSPNAGRLPGRGGNVEITI